MNSIIPNHYIEQTNLKPDSTQTDIDQLIFEAIKYEFNGVCIPPFWVKYVKRALEKTAVNVVTVIGFPFGYQKTETKIFEIEKAIEDGADELDIVINISSFMTGMNWPKIELAKCNQLIHEAGKISKVIIETGYLSDLQILEATKIVVDSGADYVKTSTGILTSGATIEDIVSIKKITSNAVGVKASGGIRTLTQLQKLVIAGASRIGTSAGSSIMNEYNNG